MLFSTTCNSVKLEILSKHIFGKRHELMTQIFINNKFKILNERSLMSMELIYFTDRYNKITEEDEIFLLGLLSRTQNISNVDN